MKPMENPMVQVQAKLEEVQQLFAAVVSQIGDKSPSEIVVAKNGSLIVRIGKNYWACPLSAKECNFLQALLQNGGTMDRSDVKQWVERLDDHVIRYFLKSINRKLATKKMPVRLHYVGWIISIAITPS